MIRMTGGTFRGRMIRIPTQQGTRPTQSMLRQALFNSIQAHLPGARVLDLFAGSGALAFEALSRGAEYAVLVEQAPAAIKCIRQNIEDLAVEEQTKLLADGVERVQGLLKELGPFDIVVADPPYGLSWEQKILSSWSWGELLAEDGIVCMEWGIQKAKKPGKKDEPALPDAFPFLVKIREKTYGESVLTTYQKGQP